MPKEIGKISIEVIKLLELPLSDETPIYIGATNIAHMANKHNYEFSQHFDKLSRIIATADFVQLRKRDNSIEYIKTFGKHLKLAVRVAGDGRYYARSLYYIETNRVENLLRKGKLKPLTHE